MVRMCNLSGRRCGSYLLGVAVLAMFLAVSLPAQAALVGYWPLDGSLADATGNGNDGTFVGSAAYNADVPAALGAGQSVLFTGPVFDASDNLIGGDAIDVGNAGMLNFGTGDWTIAAWVKSTNTGTGDPNKGTVFGNGGDTGGGKRYAIIVSESSEGKPMAIVDDDSNKYTQDAASTVNDGDWHHVVALRDVDKLNIYVDGIREGSNDFGNAAYDLSGASQHNAYIGAITDHDDTSPSLYKYFKGNIDDVALYDQRVAGNQIAFLAEGGDPTDLPAAIPNSDQVPQFVDFTYTQTDASTGAGTISGTIDASPVGGPSDLELSGIMPAATVNQKGDIGDTPVPEGMVGFVDAVDGSGEGSLLGVHVGWSGETVTLEGTDGGVLYSVQVSLQHPDEDVTGVETRGSWGFVLTDDNSSVGGDNDMVGHTRLAGWMGDDGTGNRSSGDGDGHDWVAGADVITEDREFSIDGNSWGDNIGITAGVRDVDMDPVLFFVDEVTISGQLLVDLGTLVVVPEPATLAMIAAAGLLGLIMWRRRR